MSTIVQRLREACNGHPHAKVPWPHRVLHEAADTIEVLLAALKMGAECTENGSDIPDIDDWMKQATAAIAKAEARS